MTVKIEDYFPRATFQKMKAFADQHETPFVVIDTETISKAYDDLRAGFEFAKVYYAVKANPAVEIIDLLRDKGSSFDIASIYELDKVMSRGVGPERISYGNTIKKSRISATSSRRACACSPPTPKPTCATSPRPRRA